MPGRVGGLTAREGGGRWARIDVARGWADGVGGADLRAATADPRMDAGQLGVRSERDNRGWTGSRCGVRGPGAYRPGA